MALVAAWALSGLNDEKLSETLGPIFETSNEQEKKAEDSDSDCFSTTLSTISAEFSLARNLSPDIEMSLLFNPSPSISMTPSELLEVMTKFEQFELADKKKEELTEQKPLPILTEVKWNNRNLLDLGANIKGPSLISFAELPTGAAGFLENRSQYSRLENVSAELKEQKICLFCNFKEYEYEC